MTMSDDPSERELGEEQMSFNKYSKGGIPVTSDTFLSLVAEWMINAVANSSYKQTIISSIKPVSCMNRMNIDSDDIEVRLPSAMHHATTLIKTLKDQVIPSLEEVYFCVRKGLVNKKELILYKLVLDYNEALFNE